MPAPMVATGFITKLIICPYPLQNIQLIFLAEISWKIIFRSNRPRMFPLAHGREGVVEAHGDVADEQAAGVGYLQAGRCAAHQAVGLEWRERGQFAGKVL